MRKIVKTDILSFEEYLINEEKTRATIEKYTRDVAAFAKWVGSNALEKSIVLKYKAEAMGKYAPTSVNALIS